MLAMAVLRSNVTLQGLGHQGHSRSEITESVQWPGMSSAVRTQKHNAHEARMQRADPRDADIPGC